MELIIAFLNLDAEKIANCIISTEMSCHHFLCVVLFILFTLLSTALSCFAFSSATLPRSVPGTLRQDECNQNCANLENMEVLL